jgi:hypothetical protein
MAFRDNREKRVVKRLIAMVALALAAGPAWACSGDADCTAGARCMKPHGMQQGVCKGGGRQPVYGQQPQPQQQAVPTCASDDDCESNQQCVQRVDGTAVCMPRRGGR